MREYWEFTRTQSLRYRFLKQEYKRRNGSYRTTIQATVHLPHGMSPVSLGTVNN